jgi:hypothetical protein
LAIKREIPANGDCFDQAALARRLPKAGIKSGVKASDSQRPSQTLNPHEGTEPNLSD